MKELFGKKWFLMLEFTYLILIPLIMLSRSPEILQLRYHVMAVSLLYILIVAKGTGISLKQMGFQKAGFLAGLKEILLPAVLVSGMLLLMGLLKIRWGEFPEITDLVGNGTWWEKLGFYILVAVPLQGIIFRGFYISRLELFSKKAGFLMWWSAMVFTLIHVPFKNIWLDIATLLFGLWSARVFLKCRNAWALMIAHGMVGGAEILRQLFLG